jgi:hypothetical protein
MRIGYGKPDLTVKGLGDFVAGSQEYGGELAA